jgi:hypothetical protein
VIDEQIGSLGRAAMEGSRCAAVNALVGCGCGDTTLEIAHRVGPPASSWARRPAPMLAEAERQRAGGASNARFECGRADAYVLGCRIRCRLFALRRHVFADPARAFANLAATPYDRGPIRVRLLASHRSQSGIIADGGRGA